VNIRTKIMLSIVAAAIITALTVGAIVVFNIKSVAAIAAIVSALCAEVAAIGLFVAYNIAEPLNAATRLISEMKRGHLGARLNLERGDEVGAMAEALDKFADDLRFTAICPMKKIAAGDLNAYIDAWDDKDEIRGALKRMMESLRELNIDDEPHTAAARHVCYSRMPAKARWKWDADLSDKTTYVVTTPAFKLPVRDNIEECELWR